MHLGRPWHNTADAWPQAVVRDSTIHSGIDADQPWTDMTPDYPGRGPGSTNTTTTARVLETTPTAHS